MLDGRSCLFSRALLSSCEQQGICVFPECHPTEGASKGKRCLEDAVEEEEAVVKERKPRKFSCSHEKEECTVVQKFWPPTADDSNDESSGRDRSDLNLLIYPLGRDMSLECLIRLPRSDYGMVASLNRSFRSLVRSGELYRLRREAGISEYWVYFSCNILQWEGFDPNRRRWMQLPGMPPNGCFMFSDKQSLAVGTELLVFGKEPTQHVIMRYSILTNSWSSGMKMNTPRCLFGASSLGEKAILAGGLGAEGAVLNSVELYNSETGIWTTLPSMNKPRKNSSGIFMDGKFYVIGGHFSNSESYTCGEEYDFNTKTWRVIDDMCPVRTAATEPPPLLTVVNNELYAAIHAERELKQYKKKDNTWVTLGRLPERVFSVNGWGLAFRGCAERVIIVGGPRGSAGGTVEIHSWIPAAGPLEWELLASGSRDYHVLEVGMLLIPDPDSSIVFKSRKLKLGLNCMPSLELCA